MLIIDARARAAVLGSFLVVRICGTKHMHLCWFLCRQGQLRESRIKKLESIGFSWELHMDWDSRMQQLRVFKAKYGHCNVPQQIKMNGKGRVGTCSLGTWVTMQRMKRRSGRLSERQKEQLENIGFSWGLHAEWESRYEVSLSLFRALLASALQCSAALSQLLHGSPPLAIPVSCSPVFCKLASGWGSLCEMGWPQECKPVHGAHGCERGSVQLAHTRSSTPAAEPRAW